MDIEYKSFQTKQELYTYIHKQLQLIADETDDITAILANASALLMLELEHINWSGFYLYKNEKLILGPFQGKPAVAEIAVGDGVCGTAAENLKTQLVEDVHSCCNHISCDMATSSEIVVPILLSDGSLFGVIDIDSPVLSRFDAEDEKGLEHAAKIIANAVE
ncbi:MAG: GAF domain-containing protein [Oscillospiraceae bacterium]|nr:GAF domain-containing protein [Oscillospiraceae bacterium]